MFRRFCSLGPIIIAFGAGLLLAGILPTAFLILFFGGCFVAVGIVSLRK